MEETWTGRPFSEGEDAFTGMMESGSRISVDEAAGGSVAIMERARLPPIDDVVNGSPGNMATGPLSPTVELGHGEPAEAIASATRSS